MRRLIFLALLLLLAALLGGCRYAVVEDAPIAVATQATARP